MNKGMAKGMALVGGTGLGAGLMYLFDPERGKRRRALVRDKATSSARTTRHAADTTARDVRNRAGGLMASIKNWFGPKPGSDDVLAERVRSRLGMLVRHPRSIETTVENGRLVLSGPILSDEVDHLLAIISRLPEVRQVENRLDVHEEADSVPGLQANSEQPRRRREQFELMQVHWSPTARLLTGAVGSALTVYGIRQRTLAGIGLAFGGLSLLARGLTNAELSRFLQLRERSRRADEVNRGARSEQEGSLGARTQVKDVMTRRVEVIHPDKTLEEAAEKMKALDIGVVPVCDGDRLVGMLTDRDIVTRVIAEQRDPHTTRVSEAMTSTVTYCYEDDDVQSAARRMAEEQIRRLAVLDRDKRLIGIVSLGDLAVHTSDTRLGGEVLETVSEPNK